MPAIARWCLHHRRFVVAAWLVALVLAVGADLAAGPSYANRFSPPDSPSTRALALLQRDFPAASGEADQIVFAVPHGSVTAGAPAAAARAALADVARQPHVVAVTGPFGPFAAHQVSRDGRVAFAVVHFDDQVQDLPKAAVVDVIHAAQTARGPNLQVALVGQAIANVEGTHTSGSTAAGVALALVVLVAAFGALLAAVVPVVTALVAIGVGWGATGLLTHVLAVASFAPILGVLVGLGVGVDYALFIVTRHRAGLRSGLPVADAVAGAADTSGRAVFFAGITVCVALLGQFALGLPFLYGVAVSASVTVALTMLAALTLLPALLGALGPRVLSRRERRAPAATDPSSGLWWRWSRSIERGAALRAAASLAVVVAAALPVLDLHLGVTDAGSDPRGSTTRQGYDLLAEGFGPGFTGPLQLVASLPGTGPGKEASAAAGKEAAAVATFRRVVADAAAQPGVVAATPAVVSPNGRAAVAELYPSTTPQAQATVHLVDRLRRSVIPAATAGTGVPVLVGGPTAAQEDFSRVLASKLPQFMAVVVVVAFLLLMVVFRSLLIPLVASVMNLLSVGAALGIATAVFQWGWLAGVLGVTRTGPVEVFVPVIMFSVLFGLSMDYEVFLVSRMHEEWSRSADNTRAVTTGQAETGRVITAAALIMVLVFLSFLLGGNLVIQQFGVGLASAIVVDAFVVRTVLVPALMHVAGPANWWLPAWLDRRLPRLAVDGAQPVAAG